MAAPLNPASAAPESSHLAKPIYFIGSPDLLSSVQEAVARTPLSGKVDILLDPSYRDELLFGRDWRVTLLDGSQLLPTACLAEFEAEFPFFALLPFSCKRIFENTSASGTGQGFSSAAHTQAIATATKMGIPFTVGKSCLEGGNCLLFHAKDGTPRAIVGVASIALTLLALEKQGYFAENASKLEERRNLQADVEDDFYRMAKNRALLEEFFPLYQEYLTLHKTNKHRESQAIYEVLRTRFGGTTGVKAKLLEPCSFSEQERYSAGAKDIKAKWEMTQELIAKELKIPKEQIAFLPQTRYHIDFEVFTNDKGQVFIHDEEQASALLDACKPRRKKEKDLFEKYKEGSRERMADALIVRDESAKAIKAIGCEPIFVPGCFEDRHKSTPCNFMNALLINDKDHPTLITGLSGYEELDRGFIDAVCSRTALKVASLDPELIMRILSSSGAGLHCYSWEYL